MAARLPRIPRIVVPGYPHHVTQRGVRKQQTFFRDSDYRLYIEFAANEKGPAGIEVWSYCLMPNHVHLVVVPERRDSLSSFFRKVHGEYARRINKENNWQGHLWQERFYSYVMDEQHLVAALRYTELNPVRAGLCQNAIDWRWSSARAHMGIAVDPLVSISATSELVGDWERLLHPGQSASCLREIRSHTANGFPIGADDFINKLERQAGRPLRKRKPGPRSRKVNR